MSQPKKHIAGTPPIKKSTVAQTCNQLSLFLKEKGCLRDLHLGINKKSDNTARMTIDLLSNMENPDLIDSKPEDSGNKSRSGAQMTIFYDGRVIVVDDIPADRAKDVILAAGDNIPSSNGKTKTDQTTPVELASDSMHVRVQANGLDLPIARRASLHKFLAKRKDRAAVRAPYPLPAGAGDFKPERNFDLNL